MMEEFISHLTSLAQILRQVFQTGDVSLIGEMNQPIKEMSKLQRGNSEPVFLAIQEDCEMIYGNFNMIVAVLRTTEKGEIDEGAGRAVEKFLHNINRAVGNIALTLKLV